MMDITVFFGEKWPQSFVKLVITIPFFSEGQKMAYLECE